MDENNEKPAKLKAMIWEHLGFLQTAGSWELDMCNALLHRHSSSLSYWNYLIASLLLYVAFRQLLRSVQT